MSKPLKSGVPVGAARDSVHRLDRSVCPVDTVSQLRERLINKRSATGGRALRDTQVS